MSWLLIVALAAGTHVVATWLAAIWRGVASRQRSVESRGEPSPWPSVSVIVPAWRERLSIESCLRSLSSVDYPAWEVIVVAGGSDGTFQAAVEASRAINNVHVLDQLPRGKNAALNQGLRVAQGEIIVVLDADSLVTPGWLRELVAPIGHGVMATTGNPSPLRCTAISLCEEMEGIAARSTDRSHTLQGSGGIAIHRSVIDQIGGFPEDVLVGVDWDLDARLAARGVERAFCSLARLSTERPATLGEVWRNEVRWRRAHLASLFRHSAFFLGSPAAAAVHLYIYGLSWFVVLSSLVVGVVALTGEGPSQSALAALWAIFLGWVFSRRAALAAGVSAHTRDPKWLKLAPVLPVLLCITLGASVLATITWTRSSPHFKGPRLYGYDNHAR